MISNQNNLLAAFGCHAGSARSLLVLTTACLAWHVATTALPARAQTVSDVRVVIDVSGSMKQNDPKNLRAPALRLLVELMPDGTRAGVWTFAQHVDMGVPLDRVDPAWRRRAHTAADKIHSRGLFTNIEDALRKASGDWQTPDPKYRRHILLLTDGMVDISKDDPRANVESRRRLLEEVLPALERADATVHTIALSDKVDFDLLQAISSATGGAAEKVNSAEQLQRIFLRLFEKTVDADSVPLLENKFSVDKHISDFTVLVFLAEDSPPTQLTLPSKKVWSRKDHPDSVKWHHEQGYDLISVRSPEIGEWSLQAKLDPDNRVLVVTNIRMKVDKLPNMIVLGDPVDMRVRLLEDAKVITNPSLLEKTVFEAKLVDSQNQVVSLSLSDDGNSPDSLKADGVYSARLGHVEKPGEYILTIQAKSLTFMRELHHTLQVYDSPAKLTITQEAADKPFRVLVQPHTGLIRPQTVSMQLKLPNVDAMTIPQLNDQDWSLEVPVQHAKAKLVLTLAATRYDDKPLKVDFERVLEVNNTAQSLSIPAEPSTKQATAETENTEVTPPPTEAVPEVEAAPVKPKKGFDWKVVLGLVVGVNVVVFLVGYLGYRIMRKRRQKQAEQDNKDMQV